VPGDARDPQCCGQMRLAGGLLGDQACNHVTQGL
jgi:hypothetical protein